MFEIKILDTFSAAHSLQGYAGDCERLHGHNYKIEVVVASKILNELGIAIDFRDIKKLLKNIIKEMDHSYLNDLPQFKDKNPSSENIARYIYNAFKKGIKHPARISRVAVWETDTSCAAYIED